MLIAAKGQNPGHIRMNNRDTRSSRTQAYRTKASCSGYFCSAVCGGAAGLLRSHGLGDEAPCNSIKRTG